MNTSNAKEMASTKKRKYKAPSVAYLQIKFKNNSKPNGFKISDFGKDLKKIERYLASVEGKWSWAVLKQVKTGNIYHYYHPKTGLQRLDLKDYKKQLTSYSLYIIPTQQYKNRHGSQKGISKRVYDLNEVTKYWNKDVLRIDIYQEKKLINRYQGRFLM